LTPIFLSFSSLFFSHHLFIKQHISTTMVMPLSPRYFDDGAKRPFPLNSIIFDTPTQSNDVPDYSPPDLLQDDDEDDEESLSTPYSLSPRQQPNSYFINHRAECRRRKPVPHRSPALTNDAFKASLLDKSVVFQLDVHSQAPFSHSTNDACSDCSESNNPCDLKCTSKVICGQSLLSALRKRIVDARSFQRPVRQIIHSRKRARAASFIEIPKPPTRYRHTSSEPLLVQPDFIKDWTLPKPIVPAVQEKKIVARYTSSYATSGRPSRIKGPCQACQEASDGCMRKAFNWPFPASQVFNDKGKPFVYLCNKCGLR
jgi:hypothetical protein